ADEFEIVGRLLAHAALALNRLDDYGSEVGGGDFLLQRISIAEFDRAKAWQARTKAFAVLLLRAGVDSAQRAAMEGAGKGEHADALRLALRPVVAPRDLDAAFDRFRAGVGEEGVVG